MGRLTRVAQGTQTRTFTYSTAGWLLTATNPESGATTYDYTPGGRFLKKTNANNATTCMGALSGSTCTASLDAAGRPVSKTYSDATPAVSYSYQWERLTGVSNSAASVSYDGFDLLDRVTSRTQIVGALTTSSRATYCPGGLQTETHSNGRVITYTADAVGRVTGLSGTLSGTTTNYLTSATYAAHGGMTSAAFGDGLTETRTWDYRTQPLSIARGTALALSYAYCPGGAVSCSTNNGNLQSQTIGALNATQSYTYDGLGRLAASSEGSAWSRSYGYDSRGNQWVSAYTGLSPVSFTPQSAANFDAANRVLTMSATYDNAGNQVTIGSYAMAYDAENRMISSTLAGGTTTYKQV
jgi:YD repeat-containing protein